MAPRLELFVTRFAVPLLGGGAAHVGPPIGNLRFAEWSQGLPELAVTQPVLTALEHARDALGALVLSPPRLTLDEPTLRLLAALHNLLFLAHPEADSFAITRAQRQRVAVASLALLSLGPATSRAVLLQRHAVLVRALELHRPDVEVRWWTGRRRFLGQPVPRRLTTWKKLRQVHEERRRTPFWELVSDDAVTVAQQLLELSPVSDLLGPTRPHVPFRFGQRHFAALVNRELARAVCYRLAEDLPAHAAGLGGGLEAALTTPSPLTLPAVRLCMHVHYVAALGGGQLPAAENAAAALLYALPVVIVQRHLADLLPPGLYDEPTTATAFRAHLAHCAAAAGEDAVKRTGEALFRLFTDPARAIG